jgi:sec-independent protein translocase protein TatA
MGGLSWWHWLIILAAFILLFGAKRLPDAARGVGRSLRILKSEVAAMDTDDPPITANTAPISANAAPIAAETAPEVG